MMTGAYDKNLVEYAMDNLGLAFDYIANYRKMDCAVFLNLFLVSGIADEFGTGNDKFIVGMSGPSMADEVLSLCGIKTNRTEEVNGDYSPEYWCGYTLAYYQWQSGIPFRKILTALPFEKLMALYGVLHEADISKAVEVFDEIVHSETFLARMRKKRNMTQAKLAELANISIRSVQLYEQRKNDINRAQYNNLKDIADVLHCRIEDISE